MLSKRQEFLVKTLLSIGYGYSAFAHNVKEQGWCSEKQQQALENMWSAVQYRRNNKKASSVCGSAFYGDCSEHEATFSEYE